MISCCAEMNKVRHDTFAFCFGTKDETHKQNGMGPRGKGEKGGGGAEAVT